MVAGLLYRYFHEEIDLETDVVPSTPYFDADNYSEGYAELEIVVSNRHGANATFYGTIETDQQRPDNLVPIAKAHMLAQAVIEAYMVSKLTVDQGLYYSDLVKCEQESEDMISHSNGVLTDLEDVFPSDVLFYIFRIVDDFTS